MVQELRDWGGFVSEKAYFPIVNSSLSNFAQTTSGDFPSSEFIDRLLSQDHSAFETLYDTYGGAIYGAALKIVKEEALAEDVLQETFVRVYKKIHTYDPIRGRLFTWILNIAKNRAKDVLRSKEYKMRSLAVRGDATLMENEGPRTETPVDQIGLVEVLEALPPAQKEVVELLYFKGFTQKEAAEHLAIPLGTVKSRLRLGMNALRQHMLEAKGGRSS